MEEEEEEASDGGLVEWVFEDIPADAGNGAKAIHHFIVILEESRII